jgi:hypothetical protein
MWTLLVGAAFILLSAVPSRAQDGAVPPLQRIVDWHVELTLPVNECSVPSAVRTLTQRLHFPAGIERLPGACRRSSNGQPAGTITLHSMTLAEALDKLVEIDRRYRWVDADGVIVVRPLEAWANPKNVLNFRSASVTLEEKNLDDAVEAIAAAIDDREPRWFPPQAARTTQGSRLFSVKTGATSLGEALDAIIRTHGDAVWELADFGPADPTRSMRMLLLYTFDGGALHKALKNTER